MWVRWMPILLFCSFTLFLNSSVNARAFGQILCKESDAYYCLKVKGGQSWYKLFPDEHDRDIVMRVNRMNTQIYPGMIISVPKELSSADVMDYAPFPKQIQPPQEKLVVVDPSIYAWGAYDADGTLVRWGPASAGSDWCRDLDSPCHTRSGSFRVYSLGSSDCISHKFPLPRGGAPMPYCMYFNNGQALHGEPNGLPGYNASHGCVRLYVNDAEWLRYDFIDGPDSTNDYRGTRVIVGPYSESDTDRDENIDNQD